jgi:hypothetical protein
MLPKSSEKSEPTQRAKALRADFHPPDESGRLSSSRNVPDSLPLRDRPF